MKKLKECLVCKLNILMEKHSSSNVYTCLFSRIQMSRMTIGRAIARYCIQNVVRQKGCIARLTRSHVTNSKSRILVALNSV